MQATTLQRARIGRRWDVHYKGFCYTVERMRNGVFIYCNETQYRQFFTKPGMLGNALLREGDWVRLNDASANLGRPRHA